MPLRTMCVALLSGMGPGGDEVDFWVFLVAFHWWIGPGGGELNYWVLRAFRRVCRRLF
jgi:hypothetical protein